VHNERVRSPVSRPLLSLVAVTTATAVTLAGCSSGDDTKGAGSGTSSGTASPSPSSTVKVPGGTKLTDQGSKLSYGDSARVIFEPGRGRGSVLQLTVRKVQQGSLKDFTGFILDDAYKKKASYYYATVRVKNLGRGNVGGVPVPLWGVNDTNTLLPAVNFTTSFRKCPSTPLPKSFGAGKTVNTCLVYLAPDKGRLVSVSYRPSQEYNPITWKGAISEPAPTKKPSKAKSQKAQKAKKKG
jgi:hypothetical protein